MGNFDRQNLMISPETSQMIKKLRILVIGVGAGGNEVLKNLLLMGFGNFTIIDFDTVEDSNLSRTTLFRKEDIGKSKSIVAAERLRELALHDSPNIVGLHGNFMKDFGKGLFIEHDVVISCVDTMKCRAFINDWCVRTKTPFFEMGFDKYLVNITFFAPCGKMQERDGKIIDKLPTSDGYFPRFLEKFQVCLREQIGVGTFTEKRNSCSGMKEKDQNLSKIPTIQVSSAMAGAFISTELIKFLSGEDNIRNKMLVYSGLTYETILFSFRRNMECKIHDEPIVEMQVSVKKGGTLFDIKDAIESKYEVKLYEIQITDRFIFSGHCLNCGKEIKYNKFFSELYNEEQWCEECRNKVEDYEHKMFHANNFYEIPAKINFSNVENKPYLKKPINDIGIPNNDILKCTFKKSDNSEFKDEFVYIKTI